MAVNTAYNVNNIDQLDQTRVQGASIGLSATCAAGSSANIDYLLTSDVFICGGGHVISGGTPGDTMTYQVIDVSGAITGTPNTVVSTFASNWFICTSGCETLQQFSSIKKLCAGLTLRATYNSTGTTPVFFATNYVLLNILI